MIVCEKLDENQHLPPGSSYDFLDGWLSRGSGNQNEAESAFRSKLAQVFDDRFVDDLRTLVEEFPEVRKKIEDSKRIDALEVSIKELTEEIQQVREDLGRGIKRISDSQVVQEQRIEKLQIEIRPQKVHYLHLRAPVPDGELCTLLNELHLYHEDSLIPFVRIRNLEKMSSNCLFLVGKSGSGRPRLAYELIKQRQSSAKDVSFIGNYQSQ